MPELPDVERFRRTLQRGLETEIDQVTVHSATVLRGVPPRRFSGSLEGHRLQSCRRHGKHLLAQLDDGAVLDLHFGMTGELVAGVEGDPEPPATRLRFGFDDGRWLAYVAPRQLGRVAVHPAGEDPLRVHALGPDALAVDRKTLEERLGHGGKGLKSALMDQRRIAGVGNVYADEICFQARIHPATPLRALDARALDRLHRALDEVLRTACEREADRAAMPADWLLPIRDQDTADCPRCGTSLGDIRIGGRRTRFCPQCQPRGDHGG